MGLNNEYRDDALCADETIDPQENDDDPDDREILLDPETWHDWHSEDLLNMWMGMQAYLADRGMTTTLMNSARFNDFCEFVRFFSV
jgi:hypothetical protein